MGDRPGLRDGEVQYIATQDFIRRLLSGAGNLPSNVLDIIDDHYDFLADPNVEEPGYQGMGHRSEQEFLWEYRHNERRIRAEARKLSGTNGMTARTGGRIPFYLIAMAMRHSADGKRRVVLSDDPGLIEWLRYYGIATMESGAFIAKLLHDRVLTGQNELEHPPGDAHGSALPGAETPGRTVRQRREQSDHNVEL